MEVWHLGYKEGDNGLVIRDQVGEVVQRYLPTIGTDKVQEIIDLCNASEARKSSMVQTILSYSRHIKNERTPKSTFKHAEGEMNELAAELFKLDCGLRPGEDGIIGEAMDVVNCMIDLIYQIKPDVAEEELVAFQERKCAKWALKYG